MSTTCITSSTVWDVYYISNIVTYGLSQPIRYGYALCSACDAYHRVVRINDVPHCSVCAANTVWLQSSIYIMPDAKLASIQARSMRPEYEHTYAGVAGDPLPMQAEKHLDYLVGLARHHYLTGTWVGANQAA